MSAASSAPAPAAPFTLHDTWVRLLGAPLIALLMVGPHAGLAAYSSAALGRHFSIAFVNTVTLWEGNRAIFLLMRRLFPRHDQTAWRLLGQASSCLVFTLLATAGINWLLGAAFGVAHPADGFGLEAAKNLVPTLFVTSLYESAYFFSQWKQNFQRSEALARASMQAELEALQRQLDPHFLFNSLNTLAAIIDDSNVEAQLFVEQLADVYRYVLLSRDRATVALAEELKFVEAYVALHKTRFCGDLQVEHSLTPAAVGTAAVAPLSVQMLIENALKHNVVSAESPLYVRLSAADGYVSVANNVQPKPALTAPTRVGLQNIIDRYRLLTERPVEIHHEGGFFTVRLPLLRA